MAVGRVAKGVEIVRRELQRMMAREDFPSPWNFYLVGNAACLRLAAAVTA